MHTPADLNVLTDEYQLVVGGCATPEGGVDWETLRTTLIIDAEWTPRAADLLIRLVQNYGSFVLRNAAALALAAGIEDGDLSF